MSDTCGSLNSKNLVMVAITLYTHADDKKFMSCFFGGFAMNIAAFVGSIWGNIGYLLGIPLAASSVSSAGSCYGY